MIEQSMVHLPELLKDIARPVSIYLVYLSRFVPRSGNARAARWGTVQPLSLTYSCRATSRS
jgi:hypothetical protein